MNPVDKALNTQLENIQTRTGKDLNALFELTAASGLEKHAEIRSWLSKELSLGYGDANLIAHLFRNPGTLEKKPADNYLDSYYTGKNAPLRAVHEKLLAEIMKLGDFENSPKQKYLSLRRKHQFAMLGPGTKGRFELGLNMKGIDGTERLLAQAPGRDVPV